MRVATVLTLLAVAGCGIPEDQQLLNTWIGVYEVDSITYNEEDCVAEGPEVALDPQFIELDALGGDEVDLVELRECSSKNKCLNAGFTTVEADVATKKEISGSWAEYVFLYATGSQGACSVFVVELVLTRESGSSDDLRAEIRSRIGTDLTAEDEGRCLELVDFVVSNDDSCSALKVFEAHRVD